MRVAAYPQTDGCGLYRLQLPVDTLRRDGHDIGGGPGETIPAVHYRYERFRGSRLDRIDLDVDVIVMQRTMSRDLVDAIPVMQRQGIAVVVDIDDDFHALPIGHPARRDSASIHSPDRNRRLLRHACDQADLVTVSTPALADRYGAHGRVRVLRNLIPASYLTIDPSRAGMWLGWTGSTVTHIDDLRVCGTAVRTVLDRSPWMWRTIGTGTGVADQLHLDGLPLDSTGWVPLADYPARYATLDLAVAPLQLNPFNEAKSWLKVLEAAALGVPIVASPTGEYRRAFDLGLCELASSPGEWTERLGAAMTDPALRAAQADQARAAAAGLTYEEHAWQWWEAWDAAIAHHRHRRHTKEYA